MQLTNIVTPTVRRRTARIATAAAVSAAALAMAPAAAQATTPAAEGALQHALQQVGDPYVWGAEGPNAFDCSGLVQYSFGQVGVDTPRTTRQLDDWGTRVSANNMQRGDLVFAYGGGHMGIYAGDGQWVNAPSSGQVVEVEPVPMRSVTLVVRPPV